MKNKKFKSIFNFVLLLVITGLVLYFSLKDDYQVILSEIFNINILWLLLAFLLVILYWAFKAVTTQVLATNFIKNYSFKESMRLTMVTTFFSAVTPFATGGEPYEIYSLCKSGMKGTDATNVSIQKFIIYQIALVSLGVIAITSNHIFGLFPSNSLLAKLTTMGFLVNLFVIIILFLVSFGSKINYKIIEFGIHILSKLKFIKDEEKKLESSQKYMGEFYEGAKILLKNKFRFFSLILMQFVALCCLYLVPLALMFGNGDYQSCNVFTAIVTSSYVMLLGSFVPIPGGTGGLEYGFLAFYGNFLSGSSLKAIMLLWRFVTYYFGLIIGAIVLNIRRK